VHLKQSAIEDSNQIQKTVLTGFFYGHLKMNLNLLFYIAVSLNTVVIVGLDQACSR